MPGEHQEVGTQLADEVFKEDQYSVVAYNLVTLHDQISKFATLENDHFLVRMEQREAQIYGQRVLKLLERAQKTLVSKYNVEIPDKIIVEIKVMERLTSREQAQVLNYVHATGMRIPNRSHFAAMELVED